MHDVRFLADCVPGGHTGQYNASSSFEAVPGAQGSQCVVLMEYVPGAHSRHRVDPEMGAYFSRGHAWHIVAPLSEKWPRGHVLHVVVASLGA